MHRNSIFECVFQGVKAMRKLSILLILAGISIISYAVFQLVTTNIAQSENLAEAQQLIDSNKKNTDMNRTSFTPETGDTIGILDIPKIDAELPIIEGTDEDELAKGVGHYSSTALPSENDQILLSGHRDTVFRKMGELEIGDILTVKMPYGDYSYEITDTKIVSADDRTVINSTAPDEVLTVSTCYPFHFVGNAPDRYIITALPIDS